MVKSHSISTEEEMHISEVEKRNDDFKILCLLEEMEDGVDFNNKAEYQQNITLEVEDSQY